MGIRSRFRAKSGDANRYAPAPARPVAEVSAHQPFRGDIQGLRAVAVLVVALNHAGVSQFSGGYIGVDAFFVISGFLITGLLLRRSARDRKVSFSEFYAARARRILPIAAFTLIATTTASWYFLNFIRAQSAFRDSIWATFFAANLRFSRIGTDYFASAEPKSPIQHFWSLAVEEQFYLLFPLIVMAALFVFRKDALFHYDDDGIRRRGRFARQDVDAAAVRRLTVALIVFVVASLAWSVYETSHHPTAAYFSALTRGWELGIGALIAIGAGQLARIPNGVRAALSWLGLGALFASVFVFNESTAFPGYLAAIPVAGAAFVIIGGLGNAHPLGAKLVLAAQPLRFIGDVSYSFYMWHWPVLIIATQRAGEKLAVSEGLKLLGVAFAISVATYYVIEQPLHRGKLLHGTRRGLAVWPIAISAVVVTAVIGLQAVQREIDRRSVPFATATTTTTPQNSGPNTTTVPNGENTPSTLPVTGPLSTFEQAVEASLSGDRLAAPVPFNLNPPVQKLADGLYEPGSCSPGFGSKTTNSICHIGAPNATRKLVLFGDSHARMWVTPIADFAKANNWDLIPLFKEGCVASNIGGGNDKNRAACEAWQQWAFDQIAQLKPDAVVIAHSYSEAAKFGGTQVRAVTTVEREIADISKHAKHIAVLGDIPFFDQNPIDCLLANNAKLADCVTEITDGLDTLEGNMQQAASDGNAEFISTRPWFCGGASCPMVIGNVIAYRDQSHVSPVYAAQLGPAMAQALGSAFS